MSSFPPRVTPDEVRVWYAPATDLIDPARAERALAWLNPEELRRHARFRVDDDRRMFLLGRVMSKLLVGRALGVAPDAWQWREGAQVRPEIAAPVTPVRFNLAHSAGLVVCALATNREVGVDVENLDRQPVEPALVERCCSATEMADIAAQPAARQHDRFLVYWTLKEAYLKARGLGISVTLADVSFQLETDRARIRFLNSLQGTDDRWAFQLAQPTARHLVAAAASTIDSGRPRFIVEPLDVGALAAW